MSGHISVVTAGEDALGIEWVEARDVGKHSIMCKTVLTTKK
jgi:hypothetical protein